MYTITLKEAIFQLAENNGKINMNECSHCTKEAYYDIMTPSDPSKSPIISASTNIKRRQVTSSATIAPGCSRAERRVKREKDGQRGTWTRRQTEEGERQTGFFQACFHLRNTSVQNVYALHFERCHRDQGFPKVFSFRWTQQNLPARARISSTDMFSNLWNNNPHNPINPNDRSCDEIWCVFNYFSILIFLLKTCIN